MQRAHWIGKLIEAVQPWSFLSMWPHLVIPFAFLPGITESWLILSSHFVTGLKVVSNPGPFDQGSSDLTTRQFPPPIFIDVSLNRKANWRCECFYDREWGTTSICFRRLTCSALSEAFDTELFLTSILTRFGQGLFRPNILELSTNASRRALPFWH